MSTPRGSRAQRSAFDYAFKWGQRGGRSNGTIVEIEMGTGCLCADCSRSDQHWPGGPGIREPNAGISTHAQEATKLPRQPPRFPPPRPRKWSPITADCRFPLSLPGRTGIEISGARKRLHDLLSVKCHNDGAARRQRRRRGADEPCRRQARQRFRPF